MSTRLGAPLGSTDFVPLLYHELRAQSNAYTYALSAAQFAKHLEALNSLPAGFRQARLTFDDGHRSDYELALPALERAGQTATFFVTAGWTGKRSGFMDRNELRGLRAAGMRIGGHGWSHTLLTQCSATQLTQELGGARAFLEDTLGEAVTEMSLPGGRSNAVVLRAAQAAGYDRVWTSTPGVTAGNTFLLPRFNVRSTLPVAELTGLLNPQSGILERARRVQSLKAAGQQLLGDRLYSALWRVLNRAEPEEVAQNAGVKP